MLETIMRPKFYLIKLGMQKNIFDSIVASDFVQWSVKYISPNVGLEPTTLRLRVSCSTD